MTGSVHSTIVSFLAGCQSRERLRLMDARPPIAQAHILVWPNKTPEFGKLMDWPKYSRCFPKESSVISKRVVDSKQKNRRCSAKESTILFKRSDDAKRKQSIYSQKSLNCYAVGGSNTGPKHSKIIDFPLGFREVFSLLPSCLCGFILSNTMKLRGIVSLLLRKGMEKLLIPHKE